MHAPLAFLTTGSIWSWYDALFLLFTAMIVHAETLLNRLSIFESKRFALPDAFTVKAIAIFGIAVWAFVLFLFHAKLAWWYPCMFIVLAFFLRGIRVAICKVFDLDNS